MKITNDFLKKLSALELFKNASPAVIKLALSADDCNIQVFGSNEKIYIPGQKGVALGIILRGKAEAFSADPGKDVLIRTLSAGDMFGVSSLFDKDAAFSSKIVSKGAARVLFISESSLSQLIENDQNIMYNYIKFMADRIRYLNEKIMYFTAGSTERRLALYLASYGKKSIKMTISMTDLANTLDVGRASLYRAFDKLSDDGYIIRSEKIVLLLNRDEMVEHYQ
jgi:CRP-like cAMP-binding protein